MRSARTLLPPPLLLPHLLPAPTSPLPPTHPLHLGGRLGLPSRHQLQPQRARPPHLLIKANPRTPPLPARPLAIRATLLQPPPPFLSSALQGTSPVGRRTPNSSGGAGPRCLARSSGDA